MLTSDPRVERALDTALIGFMTTVDRKGMPQTSPVWFLRDGEELIVFNRPGTKRLDNLANNPHAGFNLRGDRQARGKLVLEGRAHEDPESPGADSIPAFVDKYGEDIERLGWTPQSFAQDFSVPLRMEVTRVRSFDLERVIESG